MRLTKFTFGFTAGVAALLWVHLWKWSYPQSSSVVDELATREIDLLRRTSSIGRIIRLCVDLPGIARSQQQAESAPSTRTVGELPTTEPRWRGSLRESLIWTVILGWLVMSASIVTSFVQTGNFLFEYSPDSGQPEIVTTYFKVVALALLAQLAIVGSGLTFLRFSK